MNDKTLIDKNSVRNETIRQSWGKVLENKF